MSRTFYFCFTGGATLRIFRFQYQLRRGFADLNTSTRSHVWQSGLFKFNLPFHLTDSWFSGQGLPKEVIRLSQPRADWGGWPWEQTRPLSKMEREKKCENLEFPCLQLSSALLPSMPVFSSLLFLSSPMCLTAFPTAKLIWLLNTRPSSLFNTVLEKAVVFSSTSLGRFMFSITLIIILFSFFFFSLSGRYRGREILWGWFSKRCTACIWFWLISNDSSFPIQVLPSQIPK